MVIVFSFAHCDHESQSAYRPGHEKPPEGKPLAVLERYSTLKTYDRAVPKKDTRTGVWSNVSSAWVRVSGTDPQLVQTADAKLEPIPDRRTVW